MRAKEEEYGFGDLSMSRRKIKKDFFNQIDKVIDWKPVRAIIEEAYTKGRTGVGRPSSLLCRSRTNFFSEREQL